MSLTITGAASREFIHPVENRPLTVRECARLQSFPDTYQFIGKTANAIQQIGNAVPPIAASIFAQHLQRLDGQFGSGLQVTPSFTTPRLLGFVLTDSLGMSDALRRTEGLLHSMMQPELDLA